MPKSLTSFDVPRRAFPVVMASTKPGVACPAMQYGPDGSWVPIEEYRALLQAYKGCVVQLQRAGELVAELKRAPDAKPSPQTAKGK